jgi:hypothetical protein
MALTTTQLATLKAAIAAETDAQFVAWRADGNVAGMAIWYNTATNPAFIVWRSSVPSDEYRRVMTWTEVDALTVGKARIFEWLTGNMSLPFDPSNTAVRTGLADAWASNTTTRASLIALSKRTATRAEKLFATGTGSDAAPATMGFEGALVSDDITAALKA